MKKGLKKGKCKTKYCRNKTRGGNKFCSTCRSRASRKSNVLRYCFISLRNNAKRRGKEFSLSFSDFKTFCRKTKYIAGRGRSQESFTIDRINNDRGYCLDNIQVLTFSENKNKYLLYDRFSKLATVV